MAGRKRARPKGGLVLVLAFGAACAKGEGPQEFVPVIVGLTEGEAIVELQLRGADLRAKYLHLTFDDGPGERTEELADYLRDLNISATFFINGVNVPGRESALLAAARDGYHTLGNHGQNHVLLSRGVTSDEAAEEVERTNAILRKYQPAGSFYFRPPFKGMTSALYTQLIGDATLGLVGPIHWDIGSHTVDGKGGDSECWATGLSVERCAELYLAEVAAKKSGIVVLHDSRSRTVDLVKTVVPKLLADGYRFVPLREVPSVKRALQEGMPVPVKGQCFSGTAFELVANGGCVQSSADRRWYQCRQSEWTAFGGPLADCQTQRPFPP